jgi:hypothetical protein
LTALEAKASIYFAQNAVAQAVKSTNNATKAALDKIAASEKKKAEAKAKATPSSKEIVIVCQKGNSQLKVMGLKPVCPSGYKKTK